MIKQAKLIACPGCYPTAVQLGFLPLIENGLIDVNHLIADVKSGVSGAGRKAELATLMSETGESFKAYAVSGHRHLPEIEQGLALSAGTVGGFNLCAAFNANDTRDSCHLVWTTFRRDAG